MKKEAFWKRNKCRLAVGAAVVVAIASVVIIL